MKIKLDVTGFIAIGACMATEVYIIGTLTKKYVKQCVRASKAEQETINVKNKMNTILRDNETLKSEIAELEKKLES